MQFISIHPAHSKVALHGLETIYRDGKVAGHIRRADYAHYLGKTIAYGLDSIHPHSVVVVRSTVLHPS